MNSSSAEDEGEQSEGKGETENVPGTERGVARIC